MTNERNTGYIDLLLTTYRLLDIKYRETAYFLAY
jgi:hypothetical protein